MAARDGRGPSFLGRPGWQGPPSSRPPGIAAGMRVSGARIGNPRVIHDSYVAARYEGLGFGASARMGGEREEEHVDGNDEAFATHRVADPSDMTDLERKHVPVIHAARSDEPGVLDVTVTVGEHMRHPNEPAHAIQWIELWADDMFLARCDMTPVKTVPKLTVRVDLGRSVELRALEHCNLHGTWEATEVVDGS